MNNILFLFLFLCFSFTGDAVSVSSHITALPGQVDPYQTRSELLMDASHYTGVFTPQEAASVWGEGLKCRSAALQYTVMTDRLKTEYLAQLDAQHSNWVTGMSSPSVESVQITAVPASDPAYAELELLVETTATYASPAYYHATLWLVPEDGFWRIDRIWTEEALYPYTLYRPND